MLSGICQQLLANPQCLCSWTTPWVRFQGPACGTRPTPCCLLAERNLELQAGQPEGPAAVVEAAVPKKQLLRGPRSHIPSGGAPGPRGKVSVLRAQGRLCWDLSTYLCLALVSNTTWDGLDPVPGGQDGRWSAG